MSKRRVLAASLTVAVAVLLVVAPSAAQDLPRLEWPVTDLTGALEGRVGEIERAADDLREKTDVGLFTLFVDSTGGIPAGDFAQKVAQANGLGAGNALYVVATGDRSDALWLSDDLVERVSVDAQDEVLFEGRDRLTAGDLAAAPTAVAGRLRETLTGGGFPVVPVLLAIGVVAAVAGAWWYLKRRGETRASEARRAQMASEANALLLQTDEQVKNATQELGFVEAMYGSAEVEPYAGAIEEAGKELNAAFQIRQRLDDSEQEDAATQEQMLTQVAEHSRRAQALLAAQQDRIRELRDIERDAPRLMAALEERLAALETRLPEADRVRASLEVYAASNWQQVRGNRTEATKRIAAARESLAEAVAAMASREAGQAAIEVREATQAVVEATTLLDALDSAARDLAAAQVRIDIEVREAETDITTAGAALAAGSSPEDATRLAQAVTTLEEARALAAASPPDVLGALDRANAAEAIADELVATARRAEEARARQAAMLQGAVASARAKVDLASGYVSTRRHGVGATPRVRVAEARRHLDEALALEGSDPERAIREARRAEQLADEAYRLAGDDFDAWDQRPPTTIASGGGQGGTGGIDLGGILLGTLIGGMLSGDRGGGPGWGGTPWGGSFGGGGRSRPPMPRFPSGGGGLRSGGGGGGRVRSGRW